MAIYYPNRPGFASLFETSDLVALLEFPFDLLVIAVVALGAVLSVLGWRRWFRPQPVAIPARTTAVPGAIVAEPTRTAAPSVPVQAPIPSHILAVIAAAVHSCTRGRHRRIASVVEVKEALDWAREGRRNIFASHKIR